MVVVSHKAIRIFCLNNRDLEGPLDNWYKGALNASWANFADVKQTFNSVDSVGNALFVFNIGGNKCRLIARILFKKRTLFIRFIGTHKQYDEVNLSTL
ncbi:type II toxin-antitoxin system HigB family toxin [Dyadobacter sp. 22481]|uniref:type II toxin-antitoxin system HigB family toxin n=1 Tax=Dyadobacter sp. 22481 TaxID=3453926 RepID=UPI003F82E887